MAERPKRLKHEDRIKALESAIEASNNLHLREMNNLDIAFSRIHDLEQNQIKPGQVVQVACKRQCLTPWYRRIFGL